MPALIAGGLEPTTSSAMDIFRIHSQLLSPGLVQEMYNYIVGGT